MNVFSEANSKLSIHFNRGVAWAVPVTGDEDNAPSWLGQSSWAPCFALLLHLGIHCSSEICPTYACGSSTSVHLCAIHGEQKVTSACPPPSLSRFLPYAGFLVKSEFHCLDQTGWLGNPSACLHLLVRELGMCAEPGVYVGARDLNSDSQAHTSSASPTEPLPSLSCQFHPADFSVVIIVLITRTSISSLYPTHTYSHTHACTHTYVHTYVCVSTHTHQTLLPVGKVGLKLGISCLNLLISLIVMPSELALRSCFIFMFPLHVFQNS